nr:hypothetical protein [Mucilaginibacter sp. SP1R1]
MNNVAQMAMESLVKFCMVEAIFLFYFFGLNEYYLLSTVASKPELVC